MEEQAKRSPPKPVKPVLKLLGGLAPLVLQQPPRIVNNMGTRFWYNCCLLIPSVKKFGRTAVRDQIYWLTAIVTVLCSISRGDKRDTPYSHIFSMHPLPQMVIGQLIDKSTCHRWKVNCLVVITVLCSAFDGYETACTTSVVTATFRD